MRRKFGRLMEWARPTLVHTFGPNDLDVVQKYETRLEVTKNLVSEALTQWSDEKIAHLGAQLKNGSQFEDDEWKTLGDPAIGELSRHPLQPIVYGFGHPSFKADFDYWGKMPELTIYEASALSVGADPAAFTEDRINSIRELESKGGNPWSALGFLAKRFEIFRRHYTHTGWGFIAERPSKVKEWIDRIEVAVHPEFYAELVKRSPSANPAVHPTGPTMLNRQERETLLKLIAGMACEQYNYDPSKERSEATSRILEDIELVGLTMDAKTIRKWLKEASELVDPSYWNKPG